MRLIPAQILLIPLGLIFSTLLIIAFAGSTSVDETSPMMRSRSVVQQWADRETLAQHCLTRSIDLEIDRENIIVVGADGERWFGLLRCNQGSIYVRWAVLLVLPWLILNLLWLIFARVNRPIPKGYDSAR